MECLRLRLRLANELLFSARDLIGNVKSPWPLRADISVRNYRHNTSKSFNYYEERLAADNDLCKPIVQPDELASTSKNEIFACKKNFDCNSSG
jgi:hypothetical protein